jgi:hypothetical protein
LAARSGPSDDRAPDSVCPASSTGPRRRNAVAVVSSRPVIPTPPLSKAEVSSPSPRQRVQIGDHPLQTDPAIPPRQLADPVLELGHGFIGNASLWLRVARDREAKERPLPHKEGREVTWSAFEFQGFRHGYAGTIYKGQSKTVDRTYLYHTEHWRWAASYVALTRQRESAQVFPRNRPRRGPARAADGPRRGQVRIRRLGNS